MNICGLSWAQAFQSRQEGCSGPGSDPRHTEDTFPLRSSSLVVCFHAQYHMATFPPVAQILCKLLTLKDLLCSTQGTRLCGLPQDTPAWAPPLCCAGKSVNICTVFRRGEVGLNYSFQLDTSQMFPFSSHLNSFLNEFEFHLMHFL